MLEWQIGEVRLVAIVEMIVAGNNEFVLPAAHKERCAEVDWLKPHFMHDDGTLIFTIQGFAIDTGQCRIVIDTCIGNDKETGIPDWDDLSTDFLDRLAAAGFPAESVDTVFCTHLHVDHVGWNTRKVGGKWEPTFANARYFFAREEWDHWTAQADDPEYALVLRQSVQPIVDAGLVELVERDHRICPEVAIKPTPGHTPGHSSVVIRSAGKEAVITGDCIHHPIQMTRTDWSSAADSDAEAAIATRRKLLAEYAGSETLFVGTHFHEPTAGYVVEGEEEGTYRLATPS